jgi:hypothetical protein
VSLALEDDIEQAAEEDASAVLQRARDIADQFHTKITADIAWGTSANVIIDLRSSIRYLSAVTRKID